MSTGETPYRAVNIRKSHPAMYRSIMGVAFWQVALALNFWNSNPTFHPYGWSDNIVGAVFFLLGISQLVFLNLRRNLRAVRLTSAASVSWMLFWGVSNGQQWWQDKASLQLPIMFAMACTSQIPWLLEAPVNPMTKKKQ